MTKDSTPQRVFVGITPYGWEKLLAKLQASLQTQFHKVSTDVMWIPLISLHVTMLFIGNLSAKKIIDLDIMLRKLPHLKSTYLKVKCITLLGSTHIVMQLEEEGLTECHEALCLVAKKLELPLEKRTFKPHITLGKLKNQLLKESCSHFYKLLNIGILAQLKLKK